MGCSEGLARILVFIANFAFLLVGLALLIVGILYKVNFTKLTDGIPEDYQIVQYIPTFAIIVGAIIFFIAFLGCCGALKSNTCMLTSYGAILFIIFLLQVALGIFALVTIKNNDDLQAQIANAIQQLFDRYYSTVDNTREAVDFIQRQLSCCGVNSPLYWGINIPASCMPTDSIIPHTAGCSWAMYDFLMSSIKLIAIIALAVSIVEVVGAVLALCLSNCIRGRQRQGAYY